MRCKRSIAEVVAGLGVVAFFALAGCQHSWAPTVESSDPSYMLDQEYKHVPFDTLWATTSTPTMALAIDRGQLNSVDAKGRTMVIYLAQIGSCPSRHDLYFHFAKMGFLLRAGADVTIQDDAGNDALKYAEMLGDKEMIDLLKFHKTRQLAARDGERQ